MSLHWSWGLSTALILALVIHLNGKGKRIGWLLGAVVQMINMGFGLAYGQWTFAFLVIPASMFLANWFLHPRRAQSKTIDRDRSFSEEVKAEARRRSRVVIDVFGREGNAGRHRLNTKRIIVTTPPPVAKISPATILGAVQRDTAHLTGDPNAVTARLDAVWNDS